jgi:hypothetical protein
MSRRFIGICVLSAISFSPFFSSGAEKHQSIGVAKIDITPDYPVRLAGYAARKSESEGVAQRIWARALAIGSDRSKPAILITVDNCGVPANVRDEVVRRLKQDKHIAPERVAICSTHTHSAPCLKGYLRNLFGGPLPANEPAHVERYTRELTEALVRVSIKALENRGPALMQRGQSQAGFAANRRTKGGPVDHDLPALLVTSPEGNLRAIFASYACHCTTLGGDFNQICGDWAGYAAEDLEHDHPGAIALIALGCAGDANPNPRTSLDFVRQHGEAIASAVRAVFTNALVPISGKLNCRIKQFDLPLDKLPLRTEWEAQAKQTNYIGNFARLNLARLDRGENLDTKIPYLVQTWIFGDSLAMVFLSGEVVVDYSLRLKKEFDATRLWVNAYANDVPCYIPSERVLKEGGYEGATSMIFYDRPTRFAPGLEDTIVKTVHELLPKTFARKL